MGDSGGIDTTRNVGPRGARYDGPTGVVWWTTYQARSGGDFALQQAAAALRTAVFAMPDPPLVPFQNIPEDRWITYGYERVLVWNGGDADEP